MLKIRKFPRFLVSLLPYLICLGLFVFSVNFAFAQGGISINVSPQQPRSGEEVTISVTSFLTDVARSQFSWSRNGRVELAGVGKNRFSFTAGAVGKTTTVEVVITTPVGGCYTKDYNNSTTRH